MINIIYGTILHTSILHYITLYYIIIYYIVLYDSVFCYIILYPGARARGQGHRHHAPGGLQGRPASATLNFITCVSRNHIDKTLQQ